MALNENIIAACLDGKISRAEAAEALGGLSPDDNMIIAEAALDNDTILDIAEGIYYQSYDDELTPLDEFQLTDLPIIAQEINESEEPEDIELANHVDNFDYDDSTDITVNVEDDDAFMACTADDTIIDMDYAAEDLTYPDLESAAGIS